jgi:hypothetical protein
VGQTSEHCLGGWRWGGRAAERPDFSRLRSEEREARGGRGGDTGQHGGEGRRRVRNSNNKKIETARGNTQNDEGQYTNSRRIRTFGNAEGQGGGLRGVEASATGAGTAGYWRNTSQRQKEGGEEGRRGWGQKRRSESHRTDAGAATSSSSLSYRTGRSEGRTR